MSWSKVTQAYGHTASRQTLPTLWPSYNSALNKHTVCRFLTNNPWQEEKFNGISRGISSYAPRKVRWEVDTYEVYVPAIIFLSSMAVHKYSYRKSAVGAELVKYVCHSSGPGSMIQRTIRFYWIHLLQQKVLGNLCSRKFKFLIASKFLGITYTAYEANKTWYFETKHSDAYLSSQLSGGCRRELNGWSYSGLHRGTVSQQLQWEQIKANLTNIKHSSCLCLDQGSDAHLLGFYYVLVLLSMCLFHGHHVSM